MKKFLCLVIGFFLFSAFAFAEYDKPEKVFTVSTDSNQTELNLLYHYDLVLPAQIDRSCYEKRFTYSNSFYLNLAGKLVVADLKVKPKNRYDYRKELINQNIHRSRNQLIS
jgi:hypothetical protein